jgi:hypothetical protein
MPSIQHIAGLRGRAKTVYGIRSSQKHALPRNPNMGGSIKLVMHSKGDGTNLQRLRHSLKNLSLNPSSNKKRYVNF